MAAAAGNLHSGLARVLDDRGYAMRRFLDLHFDPFSRLGLGLDGVGQSIFESRQRDIVHILCQPRRRMRTRCRYGGAPIGTAAVTIPSASAATRYRARVRARARARMRAILRDIERRLALA